MVPAAIILAIVLALLLRPSAPPPPAPGWRPRWSEMSFAREDGSHERHVAGGRGGSWIRSPASGEAIEVPEGAVFATVEP